MTKTSLALHNLRGFAIIMVIAFHSCIAYLASQPASPPPFDVAPFRWQANPIIDNQRWLGLDLFCAFQYIYLMHSCSSYPAYSSILALRGRGQVSTAVRRSRFG